MERRLTQREDGSYTIVFIENELPKLSEMSYIEKSSCLNKAPIENGYVVQYKNDHDICFSHYEKTLVRSGRKIYTRKKWLDVIHYKDNRIIKKKDVPFGKYRSDSLSLIMQYFGVEGIHQDFCRTLSARALSAYSDIPDDILDKRCFTRDSLLHAVECLLDITTTVLSNSMVLKSIFSQKTSNAKQAFSVFMKSAYGVSDYDYTDTLYYLDNSPMKSVLLLKDFTPSVRKSVSAYNKLFDKIKRLNILGESCATTVSTRQLLGDLIDDATYLGIRVNPEWSYKRMIAEHEKNVRTIMVEARGTKSTEAIYDIDNLAHFESDKLSGHILNSEVDTWCEGETMHHCIYTHYFERIQKHRYIGLSIELPERCTVGITQNSVNNEVFIEQIHTYGNQLVKNETKSAIEEFFADNKEYFASLLKQPVSERMVLYDEPMF